MLITDVVTLIQQHWEKSEHVEVNYNVFRSYVKIIVLLIVWKPNTNVRAIMKGFRERPFQSVRNLSTELAILSYPDGFL
jgi:hypothetical protein